MSVVVLVWRWLAQHNNESSLFSSYSCRRRRNRSRGHRATSIGGRWSSSSSSQTIICLWIWMSWPALVIIVVSIIMSVVFVIISVVVIPNVKPITETVFVWPLNFGMEMRSLGMLVSLNCVIRISSTVAKFQFVGRGNTRISSWFYGVRVGLFCRLVDEVSG